MTDKYDGPSFSRANHENKNSETGYETKSGDFLSTYVPPVMKKEKFKNKTNFRMLERRLYKRSEDYYIVVDDESTDSKVTSAREESATNVKETVKRDNKQALGHSLSDILETENQAQKKLKIFNQNN